MNMPLFCKCGAKLRYYEDEVNEGPHNVYTGRPAKYKVRCKLVCPWNYEILGGIFSRHYRKVWIEERMKNPNVPSEPIDYGAY